MVGMLVREHGFWKAVTFGNETVVFGIQRRHRRQSKRTRAFNLSFHAPTPSLVLDDKSFMLLLRLWVSLFLCLRLCVTGMTIVYVSSSGNKMASAEVDEKGNLVKILQTLDPLVDPMPEGVPEKVSEGQKATEWIDRHPKFNLLYALTSFWDKAEAVLQTFRVENGMLTLLGECKTGGNQAAHATFSPDGSTYVVGHHNSGHVSFFDATKDEAQETPIKVLRPPVLPPRTLLEPSDTRLGIGIPCVHGLCYAPNGRYLVVAEAMQDVVFTYSVDGQGRPTHNEPLSNVASFSSFSTTGWLAWLFKTVAGLAVRVRRAVVHPNGKYLYLLHEMVNTIAVYNIDPNGVIDPERLHEIQIAMMDPPFWIGLGFTSASELVATEDGLLVSVRGMKLTSGAYGESGVRLLKYLDNGARLELGEWIETASAVRHFALRDDILWIGLQQFSNSIPMVQKYKKALHGSFELMGEAAVGMDVMCLVVEENK